MKATDLMRDLSLINAGWHRVEHPETGAVGIFPETAKDEGEWERTALAQSKEAERNAIILPPKLLDDDLAERMRISRGVGVSVMMGVAAGTFQRSGELRTKHEREW